MKSYRMLALVGMMTAAALSGCSGGSSAPSQAAAQQTDAAAAKNPIAKSAMAFLDAVIAGNTEAATNMLTPAAIKQFRDNGKQFAPPGLGTASFKLGEVRQSSPDQAAVQCLVADSQAGEANQEELCCLMRQVDGNWRVAGIAYMVSADQPPVILNFEQATPNRPAAQPASQYADGQPTKQAPRTAQESTSATVR